MRRAAGRFLALVMRPVSRTLWVPIGASSIGSTLWSVFPGPLGFVFLLTSGLAILGYLIAMLVLLLATIVRGRWRSGAQRLILLAVAVPLTVLGARSGDYLHFVAAYPYYRYKIAQTGERPVAFPWGDQAVSVVDGVQFRILLYDDRGKVNLVDHGDPDDGGTGFWVITRHLIG